MIYQLEQLTAASTWFTNFRSTNGTFFASRRSTALDGISRLNASFSNKDWEFIHPTTAYIGNAIALDINVSRACGVSM